MDPISIQFSVVFWFQINWPYWKRGYLYRWIEKPRKWKDEIYVYLLLTNKKNIDNKVYAMQLLYLFVVGGGGIFVYIFFY